MPGMKRKSSKLSKPRTVTKRARYALKPYGGLSKKVMYPVAKSMRTQLRYTERGVNLFPGAGGINAIHVFCANGLFDPDITGIGHQPAGFDELMNLYGHFVVHSAKITVDWRNNDPLNPMMVGVAIRDTNATRPDFREYVENGATDYTLLDRQAGARTTCRQTMYGNVGTYLGRKDILSDPDLKGDASSNPTERLFFHLIAAPLGAVTTDNSCTCFVTIDYDVTFIERKSVNLS